MFVVNFHVDIFRYEQPLEELWIWSNRGILLSSCIADTLIEYYLRPWLYCFRRLWFLSNYAQILAGWEIEIQFIAISWEYFKKKICIYFSGNWCGPWLWINLGIISSPSLGHLMLIIVVNSPQINLAAKTACESEVVQSIKLGNNAEMPVASSKLVRSCRPWLFRRAKIW